MVMTRKFKLGELFCGAGGLAAGARLATVVGPVNHVKATKYTIEHAWGVDFSPSAIETFVANGNGEGICKDAWAFVNNDLTEARKIDALAFGFPCNSFSSVGEHQGFANEKFGNLYKTGLKVLEAYEPQWFLAENVSGIRSLENGRQLRKILTDLAEAGTYGYDVTAHLYKFEEYGVPQARHRYLIVGIRHDLAETLPQFEIPAPTHGPRAGTPYVTSRNALVARALWPTPGEANLPKTSAKIRDRLLFTAPGDNAWTLDRLVDLSDEELKSYLTKLPWYGEKIVPLGDLAAIRERIREVKLNCKSARMSHIYRRLNPDEPAYTLTGSGGGGTHVYHWEEPRALTNEERAALQTFPKGYKFCGSSEQIRKQIGMAVPTEAARQIFTAILKTFAKVSYAKDSEATPLRM